MRKKNDILQMEHEYFEKVWYHRHLVLKEKVDAGGSVNKDIWNEALKNAEKIEKKYGKENLSPYDDFDLGFINGKLSAIRWMLGEDWDMLDT